MPENRNPILFCGDYKDEESCERYNHNLGEISVESSVNDERFCGSNQVVNSTCTEAITNCRCAWNDGECNADYDSELFCIGGGIIPNDPNSKKKGNCSF
jgi:hypothetical protein